MKYSDDELMWIFNRSDGRCFYCGAEVSFHAYQAFGQRNAWLVDRFVPSERGGTDQIFNWVASCPACSFDKGSRLPWEFAPERFRSGEPRPEVSLIQRRYAGAHRSLPE